MMHTHATPEFAIFDDYRPTVRVAVLIRWVLLAVFFFVLHYRIEHDQTWANLNILASALGGLNAYVTWRIVTRRPITWHDALILSVADLVMITASLFLTVGFQNPYWVFYYPALLGLSLMTPARASIPLSVVVMALYITMAFTVSPTLNWDMEQEKWLVVRILTMMGIVAAGALITGWERGRRREAVAAERQRAEENLELERKAQLAEIAAVEERGRIAREIHDGVAQSIFGLSLSLEACAELAETQGGPVHDQLQRLVPLAKKALLETRHYIYDLKPLLDGESDLAAVAENQVREFETVAGTPVKLSVDGKGSGVPVATSTAFYRILQEALANVLKHAQASEVEVELAADPDWVRLSVKDNGVGFATDGVRPGYGLDNMQQRAQELGGRFEIESAPGEGTSVRVALPMQEVDGD